MKAIFIMFWMMLAFSFATAQNSTTEVMARVNQKVSQIEKGKYKLTSRLKLPMSPDTTWYSGTVYFFKDKPNVNDYSRFVVLDSSGVRLAFDGTVLYDFRHRDKVIFTVETTDKSTFTDAIQHSNIDQLAYPPIFRVHRELLTIDPKNPPLLEKKEENGTSYLTLIRIDSFENPMRTSPEDQAFFPSRREMDIALPEYVLSRTQDWYHLYDNIQYLERNLSPITPLPENTHFEEVFGLDAWLKKGYVLQDLMALMLEHNETAEKAEKMSMSPDFVLQDLDGRTHRLSEQGGYVLIDFWYRACYPCLKAMPVLERMHQKYGQQGLTVWGINSTDTDIPQLKAFLEKRKVNYTSLLDPDEQLTNDFKVQTYPQLFLIEASTGKILFNHRGYSDDLEQTLETMMGELLGK